MKPCRTVCLAALLLLAGCAEPRRSFMGKYSGVLPPESENAALDFEYHRSDCNFGSNLRDACRRCTSVEFRMRQGQGTFCRRMERCQLEDALMAVRRVDTWYARVTPENVAVGLGNFPQIRFFDAEGRQLFAVLLYPAGNGYISHGSTYVSLWRLMDSHLEPSLLTP